MTLGFGLVWRGLGKGKEGQRRKWGSKGGKRKLEQKNKGVKSEEKRGYL